ncbi:MAG: dehydrogenase [Sulfuricurvum sp. PC08-66]|nr:MAG: dehydrogenase [Sulfuricurvum sp. PC08-66]
MEENQRTVLYAFLSRIFADIIDEPFYNALKANKELLATIGVESYNWVDSVSQEEALEALNVDYTSMFVMHAQPIESFVLDAKQETLVGLQNPVMQFYFENGYDVDMNQTSIMAPDHISIEFGFMQALAQRQEDSIALHFLTQHLGAWAIPYCMGMRSMAQTPLYQEVCDFVVEFLVSEIDYLTRKVA